MSFNDLERGYGAQSRTLGARGVGVGGGGSAPSDVDRQYTASANRISLDIFKMDSNVAGISKLVDLLGTAKDSSEIRKKLHDLTETTRTLAKSMPADLKTLSSLGGKSDAQQMQQAKLGRDLQKSVLAFQTVQKRSADRQRLFVERAKADLTSPSLPPDDADSPLVELSEQRSPEQLQQQQQQQATIEGIPESELEFQEALIEERETEIRGIETGIHELHEIFRDLGTIVSEQQSMLDNIESNVNSVAVDSERASGELVKAHEYQRKAGRRMLCLLMIFIIVLAVVLIAILV